jgi:hypothetical protein
MPVPERGGIEGKSQQPKMVKSLSTLAVFMLLGASVIALPGFAPKLQVDDIVVLAKGDLLEMRPVPNCSTQIWPDLAASCLRNAGSGTKVQEVRLVTTRR